MAVFLFVVISALLLTIQIDGYPSGAPKKVCSGSMIPGHHNLSPQPPTTSPITKFATKWNSQKRTISSKEIRLLIKHYPFSFEIFLVQIESKEPLKGVFIQGRKINGNEPVGTFINIPSETHLVQCPTVCRGIFLFR
jgi:hypothetical protein